MPYTDIGGKHRPYLEVVFSNDKGEDLSPKTFAMVDSGADHTVISYSIGVSIGLIPPTDAERLARVSGVGGNLSYIPRTCKIHLANRAANQTYIFNETVWWIYPDAETQVQKTKLTSEFMSMTDLQSQSVPGTSLHGHFEAQKTRILENLRLISSRLETGVLLGRPFFDNFEFIQFFHKDRDREDKCFFNYKVAKHKPCDILDLDKSSLAGNIQLAKG